MSTATNYVTVKSEKSKKKALGLCCLGFVCLAGLHYFYVGRIGKGLVYLFTCGWFLIGTIADVIKIAGGGFLDSAGAPLRQ